MSSLCGTGMTRKEKLEKFVDEMTLEFKKVLDRLPHEMRRTLATLLSMDGACGLAAEIALLARRDVHKTSVVLSRLEEKGHVSSRWIPGHKKLYWATDPAMVLYYAGRANGNLWKNITVER